MGDMIANELSQAWNEFARALAHLLPRLLAILIIAVVGWVIAYLLKVALRSGLRLVRFDRLSEKAGASQLLHTAALPSPSELLCRLVFWVAWLGIILAGVSSLGSASVQQHVADFFPVSAEAVRVVADCFPGDAGSQLFCACRAAGCSERRPAFTACLERCGQSGHRRVVDLDGFRRAWLGATNGAHRFHYRFWSVNAWAGDCVRIGWPRFGAPVSGETVLGGPNQTEE